MKKSQVLAAIALAFALGLAPIASTFAATSSYDDCVTANGEVYAVLNDFGKEQGMGYTNLSAMIGDINKFDAAFAPAAADLTKAINGTVTAPVAGDALYPVYGVVSYILNYNGQVNGHKATVADFTGKTFQQIKDMNVHFPAGAVAGNLTDFNWLVADREAALNTLAGQVATDLGHFGLADNLTDTKAASVYAYVEGLTSLKKVITLYNDFAKIQATGACGSQDDKVVRKATEDLKALLAAYNNTTTEKPGDAGDAQKPTTPDTGANTASEESATASVSILSGVASVVTAAGVVIRKAFRK